MCWYCYWGWPEPVAAIYRKYEDADGGAMKNGPSHIVWSDENFERHHVEWCLKNCDDDPLDYSKEELDAVRASLRELLVLPDEVRDPASAYNFGDDDVESFPPPAGMKMVKV